jgi:hypothetical protein
VSRTGLSLLAVTAVVAACVGATEVLGAPTAPSVPAGTRVPVTAADAVCPYAESENVAINTSRISAAIPPLSAAAEQAAGSDKETGAKEGVIAEVTRFGQAKGAAISLVKAGSTASVDLKRPNSKQSSAFSAMAAGPLAPGFTVAATTSLDFDKGSDGQGQRRGLASQTCPEPGTEFWFLGTSADIDRDAELYLVNPESAPAQLDIDLYSEAGPITSGTISAFRGLVIEAGTARTPISLATLVDKANKKPWSTVAVHVSVRVGRIAAGLLDAQQRDGVGAGIDWIAPMDRPVTSAVIPGIPGGKGERSLYLFTPEQGGALVRLSLAGPNGTFTPATEKGSIDSIAVDGGKVVKVDLADAAQREDFSVIVQADEPVLAAVRVATASDKVDYGYVPMAEPLTGPSVAADVRAADGYASTLLFTAPTGDAKATLTLLAKGKAPKELRDVAVREGTTVEVSLKGIGRAAAVVVTPQPGSAPLYGSRVMTHKAEGGDMFTIEPLPPSRTSTLVPKVVNDLSAGLRPAEVGN